jgi:hypothetical protein
MTNTTKTTLNTQYLITYTIVDNITTEERQSYLPYNTNV